MVFGTLHGEVVVVNHEAERIVGQVQSIGAPHSILGLCWLNRDPSKVRQGCTRSGHVMSLRASLPLTPVIYPAQEPCLRY